MNQICRIGYENCWFHPLLAYNIISYHYNTAASSDIYISSYN